MMTQPRVSDARATRAALSRTPLEAPLHVIRTETVLARLPMHTLAKRRPIDIAIRQQTPQGELLLRWDVSYSTKYREAGPLAYKLDTLVINRRIDASDRPLPSLLRLGSLHDMATALRLGRQTAKVKHALLQNAAAFITATLRYTDRAGTTRLLEAGFTRYSVVFGGERLPNGQIADAVYLVLHEVYREVLNHAPVRPLDYDYLTVLPPTAQRFYELVSYKMFAALAHHQSTATLPYSEYCLFAPQPRYATYDQVKKQLYKLHQPHLASGYLAQVRTEAITDSAGAPDWRLHYVPGPKARTEYAAFTRHPVPEHRAAGAGAGATDDASHPAAPAGRAATTLIHYFYQRFHGLPTVVPPAKALQQAERLIAQHGEARARFVVDYAHQQAPKTQFHPTHFGGILGYVPGALAAYAQRQAQGAQQAHATQEAQCRAQYEAFVQRALTAYRTTLAPTARTDLEATVRAQVLADGTVPPVARPLEVRLRTDAILLAQAGIPSFSTWQQGQEGRA